MGSIHDVFKDDEVSGQVVGAFLVSGRLFYSGRPQSQHYFCEDDDALKMELAARHNEIKREYGEAYGLIYPEPRWEIRIDA